MILLHSTIKEEMANGNIIIEPYDEMQLGANSYDVRLGNWFYEVFWNKTGPMFIGPHWVDDGGKVAVRKHGTLLGMTKEIIYLKGPIVPSMRSRSTIERIGQDVCMSAGLGDIGYSNHWTMELRQFIAHGQPWLTVGDRIAQIVFFRGEGEVTKSYTGQYNANDWPENMIPAKYRDRIIAPNKG